MAETKIFGAALPDWMPPQRPSGDILTGRYARLEPLDVDRHAAALYRAKSVDDTIWDYMPYGPFHNQADYADWVRHVAGKPDPYFVAICDPSTGLASGVASFLRIEPASGTIEVGHINFARDLQRTRAATEAIFLMMGWAFAAGYRRFEWKCDALNLPSRRAAQRFGFSYEGVFRQATVYKGRNRDTAWFACIDHEWTALKMAYETWLAPGNFTENGVQIKSLTDFTSPIRIMDDPELSLKPVL